MNLRCWRVGAMAFAAAGQFTLALGAESTVDATIEIPPAESYVLGDDIPLVWEFINHSTNSVAMLWEGCCRLNGKLDIQSAGQPVEILPPGAAAFHSFSKAAELKPEEPSQFSSLLSDWVKLPRGGTFEIGGRYTGVLPSQSPQVAEGLALWSGTAVAGAAQLKVLSVADYLDQRERRSGQRGIKLTLGSPTKLPAVDPVNLSVNVANVGNAPKDVAWPGTMQLWIVDENGFRLAQGTKYLRQPSEVIAILPGESVAREFQFSMTDLNGAPFGNYQVFLDLGETEDGTPRVPSNGVDVEWGLSDNELAQLLNDASGGPSVGMRNPPLKLLRLYLNEIAGRLPAVSDAGLNVRAAELKRQLELAGCVQPIAPEPGFARFPVAISAEGIARLQIPGRDDCESLAGKNGVQQVEAVYEVRRHLGWDIGVEVRPDPKTKLASIFDFAGELEKTGLKLAAPPATDILGTDGQTNIVQFLTQPPSANLVIRVVEDGLLVAAAGLDPKKPAWMSMFSSAQISSLEGEPVAARDLPGWLARRGIKNLQMLVVADGTMEWGTLLPILNPFFSLSPRLSVIRNSAR